MPEVRCEKCAEKRREALRRYSKEIGTEVVDSEDDGGTIEKGSVLRNALVMVSSTLHVRQDCRTRQVLRTGTGTNGSTHDDAQEAAPRWKGQEAAAAAAAQEPSMPSSSEQKKTRRSRAEADEV